MHDLRYVDAAIARRVIAAVDRFATGGQEDVKRLRATDTEWRLRVGDHRARFVFDFPNRIIRTRRVLPRGRAYRE